MCFSLALCFHEHGPVCFPVCFRFVFLADSLFSTTWPALFLLCFRFVFQATPCVFNNVPALFFKKRILFSVWPGKTALQRRFLRASQPRCSLSLASHSSRSLPLLRNVRFPTLRLLLCNPRKTPRAGKRALQGKPATQEAASWLPAAQAPEGRKAGPARYKENPRHAQQCRGYPPRRATPVSRLAR